LDQKTSNELIELYKACQIYDVKRGKGHINDWLRVSMNNLKDDSINSLLPLMEIAIASKDDKLLFNCKTGFEKHNHVLLKSPHLLCVAPEVFIEFISIVNTPVKNKVMP